MADNTSELIKNELEILISESKKVFSEVKTFAIGEVWKILQLLISAVIRVIENLGQDLSSPEKKALALEIIESFYDQIFIYVDIPWVPSIIETLIHSHVKQVLMILVSSGIDAMVATFREVGVFKAKEVAVIETIPKHNRVIINFVDTIKQIKR